MPKSVCKSCQVELIPEKNGVIVAEMYMDNKKIYKMWEADLWKCPVCGIEIVLGFANRPFAEAHEGNCDILIETLKKSGKTIIYNYERRF